MADDKVLSEIDKRLFLSGSPRADHRQYYKQMMEGDWTWRFIVVAFNDRYSLVEKHEELLSRMSYIEFEDCRKGEEEEDNVSLGRFIERPNEMKPMGRPQFRDEVAKVRSLRAEVLGTERGLRAPAIVKDRKSYQSII